MSSLGLVGGYPCEIFGQGNHVDEKFKCNICERILREPVQADCGHRFCQSCLYAELERAQSEIECARCRLEDHSISMIKKEEIYPDNAVKRELSKKSVQCSNPGCDWTGIFKDFEEHFKSCEHMLRPCQWCGQGVNDTSREHHEQEECRVNCQLCGQQVLKKDEQDHLSTHCPKVPVSCPTCGQRDILRENLEGHTQTECIGDKIKCEPCGVVVERSAYQSHFTENGHSAYVMDKFREVDGCLQDTTAFQQRVQAQFGVAEQKFQQYDVVIQDLSTRLAQVSAAATGAVAGVTVSDEVIDAKVQQRLGEEISMINDRMDTKTGTFEGIANTLHRELDKVITAIETLEKHRYNQKEKIERTQAQIVNLERSISSKDSQIIELQLKLADLGKTSYNGTFIWKFPEFTKNYQDAVAGRNISHYSTPFYTSQHGYKMCARLYPNGDGMGKGSHLSLFFVVMRGEFDPLLTWPFKQRVTFCLLNQAGGEHVSDSFRPDPNSSSFKRPTTSMNIASGCPLFLRLENLQKPNQEFLRDDTLFLKVTVDVSDITDPTNDTTRIAKA